MTEIVGRMSRSLDPCAKQRQLLTNSLTTTGPSDLGRGSRHVSIAGRLLSTRAFAGMAFAGRRARFPCFAGARVGRRGRNAREARRSLELRRSTIVVIANTDIANANLVNLAPAIFAALARGIAPKNVPTA
jgi:L-aminopeptidase/D-esterase-like protein